MQLPQTRQDCSVESLLAEGSAGSTSGPAGVVGVVFEIRAVPLDAIPGPDYSENDEAAHEADPETVNAFLDLAKRSWWHGRSALQGRYEFPFRLTHHQIVGFPKVCSCIVLHLRRETRMCAAVFSKQLSFPRIPVNVSKKDPQGHRGDNVEPVECQPHRNFWKHKPPYLSESLPSGIYRVGISSLLRR